jgi:hypothetical protein
MKYQLVIQFQATSPDDFDDLMVLEDALRKEIGNSSLVDGHDFGSGELNIFVLTNNPDVAFQEVQEVAQRIHPKQRMRVAYRDLAKGGYNILWPPNLTHFNVA